MIEDLFYSLSFYIVPYLAGRIFIKHPVLAWITGAIFWFVIFFPVSSISSWLNLDFSLVMRLIITAVSIFSVIKIGLSIKGHKIEARVADKLAIGVLVIFSSMIYFLIWKRNTPYPLELNWDIYEHITLANLISYGHLSFLTSKISDTFTFNSYSPIFQILLSIPKILFQKSLLGIYFWLEYWFYLAVVIASFATVSKLFNNKFAAFAAAIISSLVFESVVSYSPLFLIPQTLVALTTILVFKDLKEINLKYLLLSGIFIFLLHYIVGAVCIFVLAVYYMIYRLNLSGKFLNILILLSIFIASILASVNFLGSWQVLTGEEASHFTFQLWEKAGFFQDWYGFGSLMLILLGFIKIIKGGNTAEKLVLIFAILISGIALAPISYFVKFYALGGYFVNFVIALGIGFLFTRLPKIVKALGVLYLVSVLLLVFYKNQLIYKVPLHFNNLETQISTEELKAGEFLLQNKNEGDFLISDPGTQYILEALSGINSQGGVYMNLSSRESLISIVNSQDPNLIKSKLLNIHDELNIPKNDTIFVVGGRYFTWQKLPLDQKESTFYNIWSPRVMTEEDKSYVEFLQTKFKLLYKNDELAIFKI